MAAVEQLNYEAFAQHADALKIIFETLPVGIIAADAEGRILFSNPAAETILGNRPVDAIPAESTCMYGWYSADRSILLESGQLPLVRAMRGETVVDETFYVQMLERVDGVWIKANALPLRDSEDEVCGGVLVFQDWTKDREAMQTLVLLAQVVKQTTDSVVLTDKQGVIQYVNPAFEATTGYTKPEVLGKTPRLLKSGLHDAEFYRQLWTKISDGQSLEGMIINRTKAGRLYWGQQAITPIRDDSGQLTHFVSVLQDVTELRKRQEQEFQLQLARDIQQKLYGIAPVLDGFDIGALACPAYETGGDYFDFIRMADGSFIIAVGDVKGHGFSSALVMALTRAYVRSFAALGFGIHEILAQMNKMLLADLEQGHYVTLSLSRLSPTEHTLDYASAGHVSGFIVSKEGSLKSTLESSGPPLGLFPDAKFLMHSSTRLNGGDNILLLTDGITESTDHEGQEYGTDRALQFVVSYSSAPAQDIVRGLYQSARDFVNNVPQDDDMTSVVIKVEPV